jgi:formate hydrogenlyase subunit 3/multisubunit Na+/H+ antiporter MnhD subunit
MGFLNVNYFLIIPFAAALLAVLGFKIRTFIAILGTAASLAFSVFFFVRTFGADPIYVTGNWIPFFKLGFYVDPLASSILLFNALLAFLISLYAIRKRAGFPFYFLLLVTLSLANGCVMASNLLLILFFWGALAVALYGMVVICGQHCQFGGQRALTGLVSTDFLLLLALVILHNLGRGLDFVEMSSVSLAEPWALVAFLLVLCAVCAKVGALPFHTWVPDVAENAPIETVAFLPASLDKLVGIYLLVRVMNSMVVGSKTASIVLLVVGSVSIFYGVSRALMERNMRRVLAYFNISAAGYMIVGLGTGNPAGITGGLFYLLNSAIASTAIFLGLGAVEKQTGRKGMEELGGLATKMPLTFAGFLVAALAISGVPPLNGFFSKWLVYQGIIDLNRTGPGIWPLFLVVATLGSALTFALFLRLIHGIFLGERPRELDTVREGGFQSWFPSLFLALLCVVFGVFAVQIPLKYFVYPSIKGAPSAMGQWFPASAAALLCFGLLVGVIIYLFGRFKGVRRTDTFVGGERLDTEVTSIPGTHFYDSVKAIDVVRDTYKFAEGGSFDVFRHWVTFGSTFGRFLSAVVDRPLTFFYDLLARIIRAFGRAASHLHSGELPLYLGFCFLGFIVLMLVLIL